MSGNDNGTSGEFPPGEGNSPQGGSEQELNTGRPAVAAAPGKLIFVLLFVGIFIFIIVRSLFFAEPKVEPKKEAAKHKEYVPPESAKSPQSELSISPGSLPAPPSIELTNTSAVPTPPPPPPPPPPALLTPPNPEVRAGGVNDEQLNRRIHAPLISMGGGGSPKAAVAAAKKQAAVYDTNDPNGAFAQNVSQSQAEVATARRMTDLDVTIAQGKLIHAVLESAIDSSLPGPVRGIVSHDIYAEAGREVLIPKGSRLIGSYNASIRRGQSRVFMVWHRVIRPDGIDIMVDSPGVDGLGRSGIEGDVDNKYFEMFSSAILTSTLDIGVAAVGDALFGDQQTTTTNNGVGSTTTESPTAAAMQAAVQNISNVGASIVSQALNLAPTIYIDQGTPFEIFVNRDLVFPRITSQFIE